ncbi:MAG: LL-diaminopimelate aminotransferase [Elusimicrobiota bacterium]
MKPYSKKLDKLPPYIFSKINLLKKEAYLKKLDVIDLGMGNPDIPTPDFIINRLVDTVKNHPGTHRYPQAKGMPKLRHAVCDWYKKRFDVELNPDNEALVLIGSKEGIAHMCMAYLDPGDIALVANPAYPVHLNGVILAGGKIHDMPITAENRWLPDLTKIPEKIARRAKLMFLNYPNNPTSATVDDLSFFKEVVRFAKKYDIIVCHDNAYSEITFNGYVAPSFLQTPGAKDVGVEFYSLSKTYNMAGWRVGFCLGNSKIISPLEKFKSFVDYGVPTFLQLASVTALNSSDDVMKKTLEEYKKRRDKFCDGLNKLGFIVEKPKATMYLWAKLPEKFKKAGSLKFSEDLIKITGVACSPGTGFGKYGEGYVRFALVTHFNRFHDALLRLKKFVKNTERI